jgi:glycosyltransferase involved in cell wall biosynthesis
MARPDVSILLPARPQEPFLTAALESIARQTLGDFECIVILDGPTSDAPPLPDARFRLIPLARSRGLAAALNVGLATSEAPLVARMDADDVSEPGRLDAQCRYFDMHPEAVVLGTAATYINHRGDVTGHYSPPTDPLSVGRSLMWRNVLVHPSVMFRRSQIQAIGGYDSTLRRYQDYDLWLRCLRLGSIANLPAPLIRYRRHPSQLSRGPLPIESISSIGQSRAAAGRSLGYGRGGTHLRQVCWAFWQFRYLG